MTDSEFMLQVLSDGHPHSTLELIARSIKERGCGLTPHSRASDLRKRGHFIDCELAGQSQGRPVYVYTYRGSLPEPPLSVATPESSNGSHDAHDPPDDGRGGSESKPLFEMPEKPAWA